MVVPKSLRDQGQQIQQKPQEAMKTRQRRANSNTPVAARSRDSAAVQEVRIHTDPKPFITTIYSYAAGYFHVLIMASFVPFLVYFMLSWRDHLSKSVMRLFHGEERYVVGKDLVRHRRFDQGLCSRQLSSVGVSEQLKCDRVLLLGCALLAFDRSSERVSSVSCRMLVCRSPSCRRF